MWKDNNACAILSRLRLKQVSTKLLKLSIQLFKKENIPSIWSWLLLFSKAI